MTKKEFITKELEDIDCLIKQEKNAIKILEEDILNECPYCGEPSEDGNFCSDVCQFAFFGEPEEQKPLEPPDHLLREE